MRILCNLPLECFDERRALRDVELCTFGPPTRMLVDGVHFTFDVAFDPSRQSWPELARALPRDFVPDLVLLYWPDQEPLPEGLERCPVPVVGVVSDYNLTLPHLVGLWPFFDTLLCDRSGVDLFGRLSFADVRYWCQYAHKRPFHRLHGDAPPRDLDVGFAGNLNPRVQRERAPWLERVRALQRLGVTSDVRGGVVGEAYGRYLNRCRIGFNRSIRREMNLRGFEVPACGALLLMERENLEVRDFFTPDEECVLYGDDDFEQIVCELLADPARVRRIAAAGHRRVQDHRLGNRLRELETFAQGPPRRPDADRVDVLLGRAMAMVPTWADGDAVLAAATAAHEVARDDPRTLNLLGIAHVRARGGEGAQQAFELFRRAAQAARGYLPAAVNLDTIARLSGDRALERATRDERERRASAGPGWPDLDGTMLPLGFGDDAIDRSLALQEAVRCGTPAAFAQRLV